MLIVHGLENELSQRSKIVQVQLNGSDSVAQSINVRIVTKGQTSEPIERESN